MNISAPRQVTFWVAVVVAVIGMIAHFVTIPVLTGIAIWVVFLGFIILAAGNLYEGL